MTACDFQQALFRLLRERAAHPRSLVSELSGVIYKSRPTIYKKMQGHIMLTVDELIAICSHYRIDVDPLLNESPSFSSLVLDSGTNGQKPADLLLDQLRNWAASPDTQVLIDQPGPFVHAFLKPEIAAFILFYERARSNQNLLFDLNEARYDPKIVSLSTRILGAYRSISRVELWRPHMFDTLLTRIHQCARSQRFADPGDALRICRSLSRTLPLLRERYLSRLDRSSDKAKVYLTDFGLSTDAICVRSGDRYSLYRGRWYGEWTLTYSEQISRRSFVNMKETIHGYQRASKASEKHIDGFFEGLEQKIQQTSRNIEGQFLGGT